MDALADERHAPSKQNIAAEVLPDSMASEWEDFEKYVQYVVATDPYEYVPIKRHMSQSDISSSDDAPVAASKVRKIGMY